MNDLGKRILLVEDNKPLASFLKDFLESAGYEVILKESAIEGLMAFQEIAFDLCILDLLLPAKEGLSPAAGIRQQDSMMPILFFSSRNLTAEKIQAFKTDSDDNEAMPFGVNEFLMRIKGLLPEINPSIPDAPAECYTIGRYVFQYNNHILQLGNQQTVLSLKESQLLRLLGSRQNQLVKREEALTSIWGENTHSNSRSMDVFLTRLRKRFSNDPSVAITNMHGVGFVLQTGLKKP